MKKNLLYWREAISVLECMAIDMVGAVSGLAETDPMVDVIMRQVKAIDTAQYALRKQEERSNGWISVKERLPKKSGIHLVHVAGSLGGYLTIASWTPRYKGFEEDLEGKAIWFKYDSEYGDYEIPNVTHWMPLPEPPEVEA